MNLTVYFNKLRDFLSQNKIFFETIAASLISAMAVSVSVLQYNIADKQTKLMEVQTQIANKQKDISYKQYDQSERQILLMKVQTDIANLQTDLAKDQVSQQHKQTLLVKVQNDIAKLQLSLANDQSNKQHRETAVANAKEWASLRELLRPIRERFPLLLNTTGNRELFENLSREEKIRWLAEMDSLVAKLGTNTILVDSHHNYERYLAVLNDIAMTKLGISVRVDGPEADRMFSSCARRVGMHISAMWWDLGMMRNSYPPEDKRYLPATAAESIFENGFPWRNEIWGKEPSQR